VALARVVSVPAGQVLYHEGEKATCFYSLLDGEISMTRRVRDGEVELVRTSYRGVYAGATAAYAGDHVPQVYFNTVRATQDARFVQFPAAEFSELLREWFPLAMHLLEGLLMGLRNSEPSSVSASGCSRSGSSPRASRTS
jgi:CRP-like cAMP-binding protein